MTILSSRYKYKRSQEDSVRWGDQVRVSTKRTTQNKWSQEDTTNFSPTRTGFVVDQHQARLKAHNPMPLHDPDSTQTLNSLSTPPYLPWWWPRKQLVNSSSTKTKPSTYSLNNKILHERRRGQNFREEKFSTPGKKKIPLRWELQMAPCDSTKTQQQGHR